MGEPMSPPPGWSKTLDDLFEEARRGERGPIGQPEAAWAIEYERSLLPSDIRYPRGGDVYEAVQDIPVEYLTAWRAPRTGSGESVLMRGDRVKIEHEPSEPEPIGVYAVPLDYDGLESRMVPAAIRSQSKYQGFYFFLTTAELNSSFRLMDSAGDSPQLGGTRGTREIAMDAEPSGASKWLIIAGSGLLVLAALAVVLFVTPTPPWLDAESAPLIPLAFVGFSALGLACTVAGLVIGRRSAKRRPRV